MVDYAHYLEKVIKYADLHGVSSRFVDEMPRSIRPTPVRGAFRMGEVLLPKDNPEEALFVLLHGLGHMAEWTEFPEEYEKSYSYNSKNNSWDEFDLRKIWNHEWAALPFALGFIGQHRLNAIRDWYIRYFIADQYYLADIFRENHYDLQKFHLLLTKMQDENLSEVCAPIVFPVLNLNLSRDDYICLV